MKKLVVVADDFGLTKSVNAGIIKSYTDGLVTEISLMVFSPETDDAVESIKQNGIEQVGIHTMLLPWTKKQRPRRQDYIELFHTSSFSQVEKLALLELESFEKLVGRKPTHICPQYGLHGNLKLLNILIKYAVNNNVPIRLPLSTLETDEIPEQNYAAEIMMRREKIKTTNYLFAHITGSDSQKIKANFLADLKKVADGQSAEILLHPGYLDQALLGYSSLRYERARDIAIACDKEYRKQIENLGFSISNYTQI